MTIHTFQHNNYVSFSSQIGPEPVCCMFSFENLFALNYLNRNWTSIYQYRRSLSVLIIFTLLSLQFVFFVLVEQQHCLNNSLYILQVQLCSLDLDFRRARYDAVFSPLDIFKYNVLVRKSSIILVGHFLKIGAFAHSFGTLRHTSIQKRGCPQIHSNCIHRELRWWFKTLVTKSFQSYK